MKEQRPEVIDQISKASDTVSLSPSISIHTGHVDFFQITEDRFRLILSEHVAPHLEWALAALGIVATGGIGLLTMGLSQGRFVVVLSITSFCLGVAMYAFARWA